MRLELVANDAEIPFGVTRRTVDDMDQDAGPLDVPQEGVPEARTLARALDQAGNVGDGRPALVVHPQV